HRVQPELLGEIEPAQVLRLLLLGAETGGGGPVDVDHGGEPHGPELAGRGRGILRTGLVGVRGGTDRSGAAGETGDDGGGADGGRAGQAQEGTTIDGMHGAELLGRGRRWPTVAQPTQPGKHARRRAAPWTDDAAPDVGAGGTEERDAQRAAGGSVESPAGSCPR